MGKNKFYILGGIFLLIAGYLVFSAFKNPQSNSSLNKAEVKSSQPAKNQPVQNLKQSVNGEFLPKEIGPDRPIAVVVENFPEARPQSGLILADVVYEAPTEGGITRYLAIFQSHEAKNIGPVRSIRTYFGEIAEEYGAVLAHVGGNSDALANIKAKKYSGVSDADQFFNDPYFQRVTFRSMPHNVYTSIAKLKKLAAAHKFSETTGFQEWKFTDEPMAESLVAEKITIPFSESAYEVGWQYDSSANIYKRFLAGKAHKDLDTKKQISAKTVIVQLVETFPVKSDTPLSIGMTLTGEGKAYVFENGRVVQAIWKKSAGERTRYYDSQNREISFNRGQIWVELLPTEKASQLVWK